MRRQMVAAGIALVFACPGPARAYEPTDPDPTRRDAQSLPPEAAPSDRDLYAQGLYVDVTLGAGAFFGTLGALADPGVWLGVGLGYELAPWFELRMSFEGSSHGLDGPGPPSPASFELLGAFISPRGRVLLSERVLLWLGADLGLAQVSWGALSPYGVRDADSLHPAYGLGLGVDLHLSDRHHSLGLFVSGRRHPALAVADDAAGLVGHAGLSLRHVF